MGNLYILIYLPGTVHDIVNRGGRCLIPVFALGRAQELLLILGNYRVNVRNNYYDVCRGNCFGKSSFD